MPSHLRALIFGAALVTLAIIPSPQQTVDASTALTEDGCPVCFSVVNKLIKAVGDSKKNLDSITNKFLDMCKKSEGAEQRFCYFLGGQEVSATRTYKDMAERIKWGMPASKICEHLKSRDPQVCELKQRIPIDLKTVDLKKLKVGDLKRILKDRDVTCDGCIEKAEFTKKVEELKKQDEEKESARGEL